MRIELTANDKPKVSYDEIELPFHLVVCLEDLSWYGPLREEPGIVSYTDTYAGYRRVHYDVDKTHVQELLRSDFKLELGKCDIVAAMPV